MINVKKEEKELKELEKRKKKTEKNLKIWFLKLPLKINTKN
ncbi:hypothetical protein [Persephonella sp.]|nr:hypothetical protein [Persephonella sp.]